MSKIIDNSLQKSLPPNGVFVGYMLIFAGCMSFLVNPYFAIAFILVGGLFSFTTNGVKMDPENKKYMVYTSCYGIKMGKWESLEKFPYICVLSRQLSSTARTRTQTIETTDLYFDVCLLTQSHRQTLLIKRTKDKEEAMGEVVRIAAELGIEATTYAPAISQRTMDRRRRR